MDQPTAISPLAAPTGADIPTIVQQLLDQALARRASDIYLEPAAGEYLVRFCLDGLLETVAHLERATGRSAVIRLMVMAQLLTYRLDVPQEGRISLPAQSTLDLRLAIIPTTHGLRAAVRMPADLIQPCRLDQLGLPTPVLEGLRRFARSDSGMLLVAGPAGSGKTTTIYALLAQIAQEQPGLSIIALEDPVERHLEGITQIEVSAFGQLTYERALKSILRQDPQVLMLGEIRDAATATLAVQAALSGHRLISTLHAGTAASAIARLLEMQIEPYQVCNSIFGVITQRLLRRRSGEGYHGRLAVAAWADMDAALRPAVLQRQDIASLQALVAQQAGYRSIAGAAGDLVQAGLTDQAEVLRVLGESADERPAKTPASAQPEREPLHE
jgi:general secretion pathway protein E